MIRYENSGRNEKGVVAFYWYGKESGEEKSNRYRISILLRLGVFFNSFIIMV